MDICTMESRRQAKVAKLLQKELAVILQKNCRMWFSVSFITVSKIQVTADLSYAKVYVTFLDVDQPEDLVQLMNKKIGEVKNQLAARVKNQLRKLPDLSFFYDDTLDYVDKMEQLFREIKNPKDSEGGTEG